MPSNRLPRVLLVLLLVAALFSPAAWAAPRRGAMDISPLALLARTWSAFGAAWAELGCKLDPHGGCGPAQPSEGPLPEPTGDLGCKIDPNGRCEPAQPSEEPLPEPTADLGCKIDPHGGCSPDA